MIIHGGDNDDVTINVFREWRFLFHWKSSSGAAHLLHVLTLGHVLVADLDPGVAQALDEVGRVEAHEVRRFVGVCQRQRFTRSNVGTLALSICLRHHSPLL